MSFISGEQKRNILISLKIYSLTNNASGTVSIEETQGNNHLNIDKYVTYNTDVIFTSTSFVFNFQDV